MNAKVKPRLLYPFGSFRQPMRCCQSGRQTTRVIEHARQPEKLHHAECVDFRSQDSLRGRIEGCDGLIVSSEPDVYAMGDGLTPGQTWDSGLIERREVM